MNPESKDQAPPFGLDTALQQMQCATNCSITFLELMLSHSRALSVEKWGEPEEIRSGLLELFRIIQEKQREALECLSGVIKWNGTEDLAATAAAPSRSPR